MPTKPRNIYPNNIYHIYNRAANKKNIFLTKNDYDFFLAKILQYRDITSIKILAYAILPNHFHFLLMEPEENNPTGCKISSISKFISLLCNSYTKHFNLSKDHSGRIFQGPFKSKLVSRDSYFQNLIHYINLNPLKHGIITDLEECFYTSYLDYLYMKRFRSKFIANDVLIDFKNYSEEINSYLKSIKDYNEEF